MDEQANSYFGLIVSNGEQVALWRIGRLWELAASLPVQMVHLADLTLYLDESPPGWDGTSPTLRNIAVCARRINQADLSYPIIRSVDGVILDGRHRIAKAWMLGHDTIAAVQFTVDPLPDSSLNPYDLHLAEGKVNRYIPPR